uniref:Uncharacterized protein n=1 Tax=Arundo donax TaxID=35708 RepID=A0A0A9AWB1_ARUDO
MRDWSSDRGAMQQSYHGGGGLEQ